MLCAVAVLAIGLPSVYTPPSLNGWTMKCDLTGVVQRLIDDGEQEADIAPVIQSAKEKQVGIDFWIPKGANGKTEQLTCAHAKLVDNPKAKHKQLAVFATLDDPTFATFHAGYDVDDAISKETHARVDSSKAARRNAVVAWTSAVVLPPMLLYALGSAVAWVRRGFKQHRSAPSPHG